MSITYHKLSDQDLDITEAHELELEVLEALSRNPKQLPSRMFYDDRGSRLYQQITELEEYYPTACEFEILRKHRATIGRYAGKGPFNLIELGAGDGRKTTVLLQYFLEENCDFQYVPIDISEGAMQALTASMDRQFAAADLRIQGIIAEYFQALRWLIKQNNARNIVIFLGSSIGNFDMPGARRFLRHLWYALNPDDLVMIGFDLKKDPSILYRAYNDAKGVTRAFNLNLLARINREMHADFNLEHFTHEGHYDIDSGAMVSYLISTRAQVVNIRTLNKAFRFKAWEGIHTEFSYKYLPEEVENLAANTGFTVLEQMHDSREYFVDSLWQVEKNMAPPDDPA